MRCVGRGSMGFDTSSCSAFKARQAGISIATGISINTSDQPLSFSVISARWSAVQDVNFNSSRQYGVFGPLQASIGGNLGLGQMLGNGLPLRL